MPHFCLYRHEFACLTEFSISHSCVAQTLPKSFLEIFGLIVLWCKIYSWEGSFPCPFSLLALWPHLWSFTYFHCFNYERHVVEPPIHICIIYFTLSVEPTACWASISSVSHVLLWSTCIRLRFMFFPLKTCLYYHLSSYLGYWLVIHLHQ